MHCTICLTSAPLLSAIKYLTVFIGIHRNGIFQRNVSGTDILHRSMQVQSRNNIIIKITTDKLQPYQWCKKTAIKNK